MLLLMIVVVVVAAAVLLPVCIYFSNRDPDAGDSGILSPTS